MAISVKTVADKVFNLLKGYGYEVDTYDKEGNVVGDPADAIRFYVDQPDLLITLNVPTEQIRFSVSKNTEETDQLRNQLKQLCKNYLMSLDFRVFGKTLKPSSDKINIAKVSKETDMKETNELRKLAGLEVEAVEDKAYDFEPTPEAEAWYKSIVDHDDLDNMYNQWEEAFSQADTEDKVDVALHHVQGLLADGPLDDYNTLWQAWEQDEDIEDMLPKYQAMAKKSAGTPELPMMGEAEAIKEASLGPVQGSLKTSYQPLDSVKIVVKHSKPVNEEVRGSRSRNISKIFIQANEERFLFPSKNLNGARAMARHIYNGGVMHDSVGESIVNMCKDFGKLKEFIRYVNKKGLVNEENSQYVSLAKEHVENIRTTFKRLSGVKSYANAVESLKDLDVEVVNEVNLEDYFTETHFDEKVGNVHDTLSKLVNKQSAFESYIMNAIENETFDNAKSLIRESDVMTFDSPNARLGYQVSQLGQASASEKLGGYLSGIGNKLSNGGDLNQFEYRAVKASLLSAQNSNPIMAENKTAEQKYEDFIDTFIKSPEPFAQ
tara:strand:- start:5764 stop:7407 length:1644 start_codon:yes stop_codon:yes gene_type:complete